MRGKWQWRTWRRLAVAGSPVIVNGDEFENIELKQSGSAGILSSRPAAAAAVVLVTGSRQHQRDVDNNIAADAAAAAAPARAPPAAGSAAAGAAGAGPPTDAERQRDSSSGYASESGDMLRELVKNTDQIEVPRRKPPPPVKMGSADSEVSDTSNLASAVTVGFY